jgi:hypothetical protein
MSDASRREVERARAGGAFADRVALLRERVRAGVLALDRLRLAAYLGDPAAVEALTGAPLVVESADEPAVVEVTDDAAFARVLEAERAVGMVFMPWSGPAHLYRRRLVEVHAPTLHGLTRGVGVFVVHPGEIGDTWSAPGEQSARDRWLRSSAPRFAPLDPLSSGAGELWWPGEGASCGRRIQLDCSSHTSSSA